jgi:hypothetical protein
MVTHPATTYVINARYKNEWNKRMRHDFRIGKIDNFLYSIKKENFSTVKDFLTKAFQEGDLDLIKAFLREINQTSLIKKPDKIRKAFLSTIFSLRDIEGNDLIDKLFQQTPPDSETVSDIGHFCFDLKPTGLKPENKILINTIDQYFSIMEEDLTRHPPWKIRRQRMSEKTITGKGMHEIKAFMSKVKIAISEFKTDDRNLPECIELLQNKHLKNAIKALDIKEDISLDVGLKEFLKFCCWKESENKHSQYGQQHYKEQCQQVTQLIDGCATLFGLQEYVKETREGYDQQQNYDQREDWEVPRGGRQKRERQDTSPRRDKPSTQIPKSVETEVTRVCIGKRFSNISEQRKEFESKVAESIRAVNLILTKPKIAKSQKDTIRTYLENIAGYCLEGIRVNESDGVRPHPNWLITPLKKGTYKEISTFAKGFSLKADLCKELPIKMIRELSGKLDGILAKEQGHTMKIIEKSILKKITEFEHKHQSQSRSL